MPSGLRRFQQSGQSHFLTFSCYRRQANFNSAETYDLPIGLAATFLAILVVAIIFAMIHPGGSGTMEGARFGVLIGIFVVCAFVLHNYVNLDIGLKLALGQAVAYFVQWTIIGIVIGLIYKPLATP
jgi:hypothetical protein